MLRYYCRNIPKIPDYQTHEMGILAPMFGEYVPIVILIAVAGLVCAAMVTLSYVLGPKKVTAFKSSPYECGVAPLGDAIERFPIKFYLVAILFVLFDIEVVFLWSWLTIFKSAPLEFQIFSGIDVAIYLGLWLVGYYYIIKIGALEWDEAVSLAPEKLDSFREVAQDNG